MNTITELSNPYDPDFLDKLPSGIIVLKDRKPVFINLKARKDLGIPEGLDVDIKYFQKLIKKSDESKFLEIFNSDDPLPEISEWQGQMVGGIETWVQIRVAKLDSNHEIVIIRDIGKIKSLLLEISAKEKQYQELIEKAPNFLFIFKNGCIEYFNQAFIDKLGYSREEIEARKKIPTFLIAPEHREKVARFLLDSKRWIQITGNVINYTNNQIQIPDESFEFDLLKKDGSRVPVYAIIKRVFSGKDSIVQGVMIDLSSIRELNDLKFNFLTLSQHQLRGPVANLKGHLDFYAKRLHEGLNKVEKENLERNLLDVFSRNINRMITMIDDLNDVAAVRYGKLKCYLRGEDFIPILQKTIEDQKFFLQNYRIDLLTKYPSHPCVLNLDRNRISQALRNIIDNAIRFTGHGTISINVLILKNNLNVSITDTGIGLTKDQLTDVGKPFVTFHPSQSGLGLGLYLTKQIIIDHGGSMEINSKGYHKGTSVKFTLPLLIPYSENNSRITYTENGDYFNDLIKIATSSEDKVERIETILKLGNKQHTGEEFDTILKALENIILYDPDIDIRNLASEVYKKQAEFKKDNSSNAT